MKELVLDSRAEKTNKAKPNSLPVIPVLQPLVNLRPAPILTRHASELPSFPKHCLTYTHYCLWGKDSYYIYQQLLNKVRHKGQKSRKNEMQDG